MSYSSGLLSLYTFKDLLKSEMIIYYLKCSITQRKKLFTFLFEARNADIFLKNEQKKKTKDKFHLEMLALFLNKI